MSSYKYSFFLLLFLLYAGCSGSRVSPVPPTIDSNFPNHSLSDIIQKVQMEVRPLDTFESKATLNIDSPELSQQVNATLRFKQNEAFYASIRATFLNAEVARMRVTPDSFYVYNRIEKELIYGPASVASNYMPISGTLEEIHDLLLGTLVLPTAGNFEKSIQDNSYILSNSWTNEVFEIDPRYWRIVRYEKYNQAGQLESQATFDAFEQFDSYFFPRSITLDSPSTQTLLVLYHRDIKVSPQNLDTSLDIDRATVKTTLVRN